VSQRLLSATYLYALSQIRGIGRKSVIRIATRFPDAEALINAPKQEIEKNLDKKLSKILLSSLQNEWPMIWDRANRTIARHLDAGITPIPITESGYPPLLKLIPDPPTILYVKGVVSSINNTDAVAIVGTREPTELGRQVAYKIAKRFAKYGFVIVSGLAKGIDTSAHRGALDAGGLTVAVLGTALDKIYPAENKPLADEISENSGALVSELELGKGSNKRAFVERDRLQSGLSLGVIPVQTGVRGGTMHTARFAGEQGRLLFCPKPPDNERYAAKYTGVLQIISSGRAKEFNADDYKEVIGEMKKHKVRLLSIVDHEIGKFGKDNKASVTQLEMDFN